MATPLDGREHIKQYNYIRLDHATYFITRQENIEVFLGRKHTLWMDGNSIIIQQTHN